MNTKLCVSFSSVTYLVFFLIKIKRFGFFKKTVQGTLNIAIVQVYNYVMLVTFIPVIGYFYFTFHVIIQNGHFS